MIAAARAAAFDVLQAVNGGRADLPTALARARVRLPDERDRALAGEIAAGTLRWQGAFDHVIAEFSGRAAGRLDPEVLDILRMAAFQLLHLDRVPASAAVDDAVSLTRKARKASAAGMVNAVLRRISRERARLPLPLRDAGHPLPYLSTTLSHPEWLVSRWLERYGFEAAEAWARFNNDPPAMTLRANALKTTRNDLSDALARHGVHVEPAAAAPDGLVVTSGNPLLTPLAGTGQFIVQDEASQLVASLVGAQPGERVLDACAAPGGKTTAIAAGMANRGRVVAADVRVRRVELLTRTVQDMGATSVSIVRADASRPLPFPAIFDAVLLDVPCSGLGTLRRDPDIRWRRAERDLPDLASVQRQMIAHAADVVRPGGRLVYATCSSEPEENEDVISAFLEAHRDFHLAPADGLPPHVRRFVGRHGCFQTLPFRDRLEAFFGAMLVKTKDLR